MELTIVNPHAKYAHVRLIEPPATGYLLLAAVAAPIPLLAPATRATRPFNGRALAGPGASGVFMVAPSGSWSRAGQARW